ncbi:hypothetical protein HDA36_006243 [Nocardiopsis composta]|uniref:Uncharacterized protein n=1 Tax=Nocardiopsis composta TaxID=157465 RepID=A0A7W8QU94_9ACTN|nr:hypothetical protein [Nocardiopsis composta]
MAHRCARRAPAHLAGGPDDVYQRVAPPEAPTPLSLITQSGENEGSRQGASATAPYTAPFRFPAPTLAAFPATRTPQPGPDSPPRPHCGPGCTPRRHRGDVGMCRAPLPPLTLRIHPGQEGFGGLDPANLTVRKTWARHSRRPRPAEPPHRHPPAPTSRPTAPNRPAHPRPFLHRCRPLERPLRDAPHPADAPDPGPTSAVAACLNARSAGRRTRVTPPPRPFLHRCRPLERPLRDAPHPADAPDPGPTSAVAACLNARSAGRRTRPTSRPRPHLRRRHTPEPHPATRRSRSPPGRSGPATVPVPLPARHPAPYRASPAPRGGSPADSTERRRRQRAPGAPPGPAEAHHVHPGPGPAERRRMTNSPESGVADHRHSAYCSRYTKSCDVANTAMPALSDTER